MSLCASGETIPGWRGTSRTCRSRVGGRGQRKRAFTLEKGWQFGVGGGVGWGGGGGGWWWGGGKLAALEVKVGWGGGAMEQWTLCHVKSSKTMARVLSRAPGGHGWVAGAKRSN